MSTTYGAAGLGQTAASTRRVSSFFKRYWGAFQERHKRQRLRAALCDLSDRSSWISVLCAAKSTMSPRTEVSTREASDPPDERPISGNGGWPEVDTVSAPQRPTGSKGGVAERRENLLATRVI